MQSPSRLPQVVRGSSAAAIATFAALFSHVAGGGAVPGMAGICVPLLLSLMVCVLLAGRRLSLTRLSLSVITSQVLFHTLFVLGTPASAPAAQTNMPGGHHDHGMMQMPIVSEHTMMLMHGDSAMWVSHFISAMVTIAFLYRGERAIRRLRALAETFIDWMRRGLDVPLRLPVQATPARILVAETSGWTVLSRIRNSTLRRRGPPFAYRIAR